MVLRVVVRGELIGQSSGLQQPLIVGFSSKKVWELKLRVGCESPKKVIYAALLTPHPPFVPSNLSKAMVTQAPKLSANETQQEGIYFICRTTCVIYRSVKMKW